MRVLITGITGFAGSFLAEHVLAQGNVQVFGVGLPHTGPGHVAHLLDRLQLFEGSLKDRAWAGQVLAATRPDFVFHLAAQAAPTLSFADPGDTLVTNIVSQVNRKPWSCRVAGLNGELVYLNAGVQMGVEKGMELQCFHMGKEIMDPTTGLLLGNEETPVGKVKIEGPLGDSGDGSISRLIKGSAPSVKDICRLTD